MSKYGETMSKWEHDQDERDWKRRCEIAISKDDRDEIVSLIEEGVEDDFDPSTILELEKL